MNNYWVDRVDGKILAVYDCKQKEAKEKLAEDHPDIIAFLKPSVDSFLFRLEIDLHQLINKYFDAGTQASLLAIFVDPDTPEAVRTRLFAVRDWTDSVLDYYYEKKEEIQIAEDPSSVGWDFFPFDDTVPVFEDGEKSSLKKIRKELKELKVQ